MKRIPLIGLAFIFAISLCLTACLTSKKAARADNTIYLNVSNKSVNRRYSDLEKSLKLVVNYTANNSTDEDEFQFEPSERIFVNNTTQSFVSQMGFNLTNVADYTLTIDIRLFRVSHISRKEIESNIKLSYKMINAAGETIIPTTSVSSVSTAELEGVKTKDILKFAGNLASTIGLKVSVNNSDGLKVKTTNSDINIDHNNVNVYVPPIDTSDLTSYKKVNNETLGLMTGDNYIAALCKINWDRIANCLQVAKTPEQEKNAQVTGAGDTALEHTVIRWYIQSSPQGADVSWRVLSSTPDVSNTNSTFVGSTPYESTEAFDIRGLTYNNSGNVQIEVSCEKKGYLTQRKRFNLRQAIDQKEISTKFNLIKED